MRLIMIHGRDQAGKNRAVLEKEWTDALSYGLSRANLEFNEDWEIEFPFYADELARLVEKVDSPLVGDANAKGTQNDAVKAFRGQVLAEIVKNMGLTDADVSREIRGTPGEKGPLNWEWVQAMLRALDRIPGLNATAIDAFTRDVYLYLTVPGIRSKIDGMVAAAVGSDDCVVIGHSLGTIVAYNVLRERPASSRCARFVTLGSPLGIKAIKNHLKTPLRSPACVQNWFNGFDERDVVALVPLDAQNFDVTPPIENYNEANNFTDNRHGIAGYLADPLIAEKIAEFL